MPFLVGSCMIRRLFSLCAGYLKKKKEGIQHNALHSVHFACKLVIFFLLFFFGLYKHYEFSLHFAAVEDLVCSLCRMQTEKKESAAAAGEKPPSFCDRLQRAFHARPAFRPLRRLGVRHGQDDDGGGGAPGSTVDMQPATTTTHGGGPPRPVLPPAAGHAPAPVVLPPAVVKPAAKPAGGNAPAPVVLPSAPAARPPPPSRRHGHAHASTTGSAPAAEKVAATTTRLPPGIPVPVPPPAAAAAADVTTAAVDAKEGGGDKEQQGKGKTRVSSRVRKAFSSK